MEIKTINICYQCQYCKPKTVPSGNPCKRYDDPINACPMRLVKGVLLNVTPLGIFGVIPTRENLANLPDIYTLLDSTQEDLS